MSEKEQEIFRNYYLSEIDSRWRRLKWIKEKEREHRIEHLGVWDHIRILFNNATLAYVYELYPASILCIGSSLEAYISSKISPKKVRRPKYLSQYIDDAKEEGLISEKTYSDLKNFNSNIRNHVVHPKGPITLTTLGFKLVEYSGTKSTWESLDRKPMHLLSLKQIAKNSIQLFMKTVEECVEFEKRRGSNIQN